MWNRGGPGYLRCFYLRFFLYADQKLAFSKNQFHNWSLLPEFLLAERSPWAKEIQQFWMIQFLLKYFKSNNYTTNIKSYLNKKRTAIFQSRAFDYVGGSCCLVVSRLSRNLKNTAIAFNSLERNVIAWTNIKNVNKYSCWHVFIHGSLLGNTVKKCWWYAIFIWPNIDHCLITKQTRENHVMYLSWFWVRDWEIWEHSLWNE